MMGDGGQGHVGGRDGGRIDRIGGIAAGDLVAEARAGAGVVAGEHHPDRTRGPPTASSTTGRSPSSFDTACAPRSSALAACTWLLATRSASLLPTLPGGEPLAGQHLRHRGGQAVDVGVVHHVGGGLARRVRELLGLALRPGPAAGPPPSPAPGWGPPAPRSACRRRSSRPPRAPGWWRTRRCPPPASAAGDEVHDVPAVGQHHRALHRVLQPVERRRARQRLARDHLVGQ